MLTEELNDREADGLEDVGNEWTEQLDSSSDGNLGDERSTMMSVALTTES